MRVFKSARLCCPRFVKTTKPDTDAMEQLRVFPMLDSDEQMHELNEELAEYKTAAADIPAEDKDRLVSWHHQQKLPAWKKTDHGNISFVRCCREGVFPLYCYRRN